MQTIINFPTKRVEHDHCPECGNRNGAFERLGSGICNECLDKRSAAARATEKQTTRRQSREGQRNAKAELAYQDISDLGSIDPRNSALEGFSVPSLSEPGVTRTVAHDMASDRYHCDCTHGQYGGRGECYHMLAARRRVDERRAQWQAAYERDSRAGGYNDTLNLMYGVQPTSEW